MARPHRLSAAILVAALMVGATGCGPDDDPSADPSTSPSATTPAPTTATVTATETSPTTSTEAWRAKFTKRQLTAYDHALATWKQYGDLTARYRKDPVDRATIQNVFEKYTHNATALTDSYEANFIKGGVRIYSQPTPLSQTGRKISLNPKGSLVEFDQCNDYTTLDIRRKGKPVHNAAPTKNATAIVRVQMDSDAAGNWRVFTSKVVDKPCA